MDAILLLLFGISIILSMVFDFNIVYPLIFGSLCFGIIAKRRGFSWNEIGKMMTKGTKTALIVIKIFVFIGLITGAWRICGTIPFFVYWGTKLIAPSLFILCAFLITCFMALACNSKTADNSTLIVLGAQVRPEGVPSLILRGRIDAAEKYLDEHREAKAVLAGGMGFDEPMSEAKCMYDTMVEDGISPDRLIMEDKSKNTMENFRYSREVLADNDLGEDITVTTDSFHMLRAMLIVRQQGFKGRVGAVCAETRLEFLPTYVVREWFALPFQLIR